MRTASIGIALTLMLVTSTLAQAQSWRPPADNQRCPSKWGAADERGSGNHMGKESVLRAAKLIKTGEHIDLAHVLSADMPFFGTRRFDVHTKRTFLNPPANRRGSNEEVVISEMGQVGTQFDGFAHQSIEYTHYNCIKTDDIATRTGFTKLGVEKVGTLMTRGVLIDVAAFKGVDMLGDTYEITNGSPSKTPCSSAPTTPRSKSPPTPIVNSRCQSTKSCSSSTASTSWKT